MTEHIDIPCFNGPPLIIPVKSQLHKGRSQFQEIAVYDTDEFGKCLLLDGSIQCTQSDHELYDRIILKKLHPADRRLLILGGGDGYIAETALKLNPNLEITIVDLDSEVMQTCQMHLQQDVFKHPQVELIVRDAFQYLRESPSGGFDAVICDLTDFPVGFTDTKIVEFYKEAFSQIRNVLKPQGWMSAYAGIKNLSLLGGRVILVLKSMLAQHFSRVDDEEASIPSFGELCHFLYATSQDVVVERCDLSHVDEVMTIVNAVSSDGLRDWENAEVYIREKLGSEKNINLILREGGRAVGYMMAVPQNDAARELCDADPMMPSYDDGFYVMLIEILPCARKKSGLRKLIYKMVEDAAERFSCRRFSMHARVSTGLSAFVQKHFEHLPKTVRRIENWRYYANREATDYIEGNYFD